MISPAPGDELSSAALDTMLEETRALVRIPTVSADAGPAMRTGADAVAGLLGARGFDVSLLGTPTHPLVAGRRLVDPSLPTILVYGHYDVQPVGRLEDWHSAPFDPVVRDGRLHGRGTADSKGQLVAAVAGIDLAHRLGAPPCNVVLIADGEEEIGSPNLAATCTQHRDLLAADLVMAVDGSIHPSGRPVLALGARGLLCLELVATDQRVPLHSGNFGGAVPSPADRIARALVALGSPDGALAPPLAADAVTPTGDVLALVDALPAPELPDGVPARPAAEHYRRILLHPTFNVSSMEAGYTGPGFATTIPTSARARVDARLVPDQDPERLAQQVRDRLQELGIDVEVRMLARMPPTSTTPLDSASAAVTAALEQAYGRPPVVLPRLAGTVPVSILSDLLGVPAMVVPHGNPDQNNHAPNENLVIGQLRRAAEAMARTVRCPGLG
ncbi:M20/M25/M40 family metallo-hydrolase [Amycolatopsis jejuensis]|uniref:M20/M25/M40 family metallo-hydrolase n=1 Tax=Amycolatopsis jejuensis TaxID=330084 RepID=UPI00068944B2|nr:M20/M25/M40 family metallo-hydrolase [Amycolatopsis jejuensis]